MYNPWITIGGITKSLSWTSSGDSDTVTLPKYMVDKNYIVNATMMEGTLNWNNPGCRAFPLDNHRISIGVATMSGSQGSVKCCWLVMGYTA